MDHRGDARVARGKELFTVSIRRTIGGKAFDCYSTADTKVQIARVTRSCRSLRAAK
jgi:hypothetical protein